MGINEGRFPSTVYYDNYCYLPLYVFLRPAFIGLETAPRPISTPGAGSVEEVGHGSSPAIRQRWPGVRILLRADSGFCPRSADGLVREQRGGIPVRPGAQ